MRKYGQICRSLLGSEMLIRTIDAMAGVLTGHTGFLMPVRDIDHPRPRSTRTAPLNPQLLIDAMGACRSYSIAIHVDYHSPLHSAVNMLQRAIDAVALLLTGDRELFWARGSAHIDAAKADRQAADARARELAERQGSSQDGSAY